MNIYKKRIDSVKNILIQNNLDGVYKISECTSLTFTIFTKKFNITAETNNANNIRWKKDNYFSCLILMNVTVLLK